MNKTVTINLSGIIFHIDEDAFQKLSNYLSTIRGYFSESEGRDEIMADIENRIAEMLSAKVSTLKQVVIMMDVDNVIELMGKPEDFAGEQSQTASSAKSQTTYSKRKNRRVFRDGENKLLGGVCSGIANYFGADPLWLRLALVVAFFVFGSGFLLYIVLWMVIPEAKTTAEKLEMKGEDVNFSNIGKKVEEEINTFGKKAESWAEEVKSSSSQTRAKARDFIDQLLYFLGSLFGSLFKVATKIIGVFIAIIGMILLIGMVSTLFGRTGAINIDGEVFSLQNGFNLFFRDENQATFASIALFLFIGIPLIMLVYGGIKLLLGIKTKNKYVSRSAGALWLAGLILVIILGNQIAGMFTDESTHQNKIVLASPKSGTLYLKVKGGNENSYDYDEERSHNHVRINIKNKNIVSIDNENINLRYPELNIVRSETDSFEVVIYAKSRGKDRKEALRYAKNISYELAQTDSVVEFMPYFSMPLEDKWRAQQVYIELRVPKNKMVYMNKSMRNIIYDIKNETDTWDGDMVGRKWIMGTEELKCIDCYGIESERKVKRRQQPHIPEPPIEPTEPEDPSI
jgi:phage shock protein PspC (stress-responsive transcriptional regulator)